MRGSEGTTSRRPAGPIHGPSTRRACTTVLALRMLRSNFHQPRPIPPQVPRRATPTRTVVHYVRRARARTCVRLTGSAGATQPEAEGTTERRAASPMPTARSGDAVTGKQSFRACTSLRCLVWFRSFSRLCRRHAGPPSCGSAGALCCGGVA